MIGEKHANAYIRKTVLDDRLRKVMNVALRIKNCTPIKSILDVGCSDGAFVKFLAEALDAEAVYGVDISERAVEIAKKRGVKAFKLNVNLQDFPFPAEYFDLIFAGEIIEHIFDTDHFLHEIYIMLKQGGAFILTTPNLASVYNRISLLLGYQPFKAHVSIKNDLGHLVKIETIQDGIVAGSDHIRLCTYRALGELLTSHGFTVVKSYGVCARMFQTEQSFLARILRPIDAVASRIPSFSSTIIVWCEKQLGSDT